MRVYIDIETFATANLKRVGMFRYGECPDCMVLCIHAKDSEGVVATWNEMDPSLPSQFATWAADPTTVWVAHNAGFEITILSGRAGQAIGFPQIPLDRWIDTAAKCRSAGLPGKMEDAAKALGLPIQKDLDGAKTMLSLSKPRKPSKKNKDKRWTPATRPEKFQKLYEYCGTDVEVMILIDEMLPDLIPEEQRLWRQDYIINNRGLMVDTVAIRRALDLRKIVVDRAEHRCLTRTGLTTGQRDKVMEFCAANGVPLADYTADTIAYCLARKDIPDLVREVLRARQIVSRTSTNKYKAMADGVCGDGRLRGTFMFYGAGTGRWSGKFFQPHNLSSGDRGMSMEAAVDTLLDSSLEVIELLYGDPMDYLSNIVRGMIVAADGHELLVCDYAGIEARVIQWLAGHTSALDIFLSGKDPYRVLAAAIFGLTYEEIGKNSYERKVGKQGVLGLGFAMGWRKFLSYCIQRRLDITEELSRRTVNIFRDQNAAVVDFWKQLNNAAIEAIETPGEWVVANDKIRFHCNKTWLYMELPSGRRLSYFMPTVQEEVVKTEEYSFKSKVIRFYGVDTETRRWAQTKTYGGKLAENATQAVARDLLSGAILRLEDQGKPVVLHVHDEPVIEVPIGTVTIPEMETIMCDAPSWATGLPIKAEGFICQRYQKQ